MAPPTEETHAALAALNPDGAASGAMPQPPGVGSSGSTANNNSAPIAPASLDPEVFYSEFSHPHKGRAHGPSGWRMEDYALVAKHCVVQDEPESSQLYKVASAIAAGRIPAAVRPYFGGGRLIGLTKPNGSVRPIVIGEALHSPPG